MKQSLENAFPKIIENDCLSFTDTQLFFIFEDEQKVSQIGNEGILEIMNPNNLNLGFLKIDGCFLKAIDGQKCDCALFSDDVFCFIEIKDVKKKQRADKKRDAYEQLANTIRIFQDNKISFENYSLEAIVVLRYNQRYPVTQRTLEGSFARKAFADDFNAKLLEGNQKTFEK